MNLQESVNYSRSTSTTPISSLRPRTRRKISGLEEGETLFAADGSSSNTRSSSTPFDSPSDSRSSSPAVSNQRHLSRRTNTTTPTTTKQSFHEGLDSSLSSSSSSNAFNSQDPLGSLSDLWGNSWTTIQGLASNVLGANDPSDRYAQQRRREGGSGNARRPLAKATLRSWAAAAQSFPSSNWSAADTGAESRIGVGSREERDALVRARKRQDLLTGGGLSGDDMAGYQNAAGVYKRRMSDDRGDGAFTSSSSSVPPPESEERDALVYLHHVQVNDTFAGISIKYNCPAVIVRKVNRMWPNDSVQIRKTMMIPVDACTVKGKKVPDPISGGENGVKKRFMEDDEGIDEDMNDMMNNKITIPSDTISTTAATTTATNFIKRMDNSAMHTLDMNDLHRPTSSDVSSQASNSDPPWKHDSWVLLSNSSTPTQIVRLPRRALGFFPPARRKSVTFSDTSAITPRASFDIQNLSFSPSTPPTSNHVLASTTATGSATSNADYFAPASAATLFPSNRDRSHSNTSSSASAAALAAAASPLRSVAANPSHPSSYALRGPGGVGTLGRSVRTPGPAQDGLNKLFGPHLPNLAPPSNSHSVPWITEEEADPNGLNAAAVSSMYGSSPGFDLENVGGAIEGWMRRMATHASRAANALAESKSMSSSPASNTKNGGIAGMAGFGSLGINNRSSRSNSQSEGGRSRGRNYSGGSNGDFGTGLGNSGGVGGRGRAVAGDLIELTDSLELGDGSGVRSSSRLNRGGGGGGDGSGTANDGSERLRGRIVGSLPSRGFSPANAKGGKGD